MPSHLLQQPIRLFRSMLAERQAAPLPPAPLPSLTSALAARRAIFGTHSAEVAV